MSKSTNEKAYDDMRYAQLLRDLRDAADPNDRLDPEIKASWVKALRSGEYKQGKRALCKVNSDGVESFCCLGVLANEEIDAYWILDGTGGDLGIHSILGDPGGLPDDHPGVGAQIQWALMQANDGGLDFARIADAIEECL